MRGRFDRSDQKKPEFTCSCCLSAGCASNKQQSISLRCRKIRQSRSFNGGGKPNLLSDATLRWVSGGTGGAGRDRTDDILLAKQTLSQLSYGPMPFLARMVGPGRLELPTSRLSGVRSNHLSYGPSGSRQRTSSSAGERQDEPAADA